MRPPLSNWLIAALLALLLPLQSFAAISICAPLSAPHQAQSAHEHCAEHPTQGSGTAHHGCCSDCCMAALAQSMPTWIPPRAETPSLFLPVSRAPLMISLDRLDRPPRHSRA